MQLTSFSSLRKCDSICSQFSVWRCLGSDTVSPISKKEKQIIFFQRNSTCSCPKNPTNHRLWPKMKSVIASHFKCFLPHSLVISVIFLLSTQPVRNCIEFQFGESQCNKRRNLQIDHKSSYGCSTDIEAQVETMTHMFQHDQYLLEIVRDLNGYFRLCEKSVRFQIE